MKRHLTGWAIMAAIACAAQLASAKVVNIDFGLHNDHPSGPTSVGYVGVGAAPDAGTTWNNVEVLDNNAFIGPPGEFGFWSTSVAQSNLLDSHGAVTPIGVNLVASN